MKQLDVRSINETLNMDGPSFILATWDENYFQTPPKGYIGFNKGRDVSEETRKKISEARKGKTPWNKGVPHTEETKKRISKSNIGKVSYWKGKKQPIDAVNKMKKSIKGKRSGELNSNSKTYKITFDNGNIIMVKSLQTWATQNGYKPTSLRNLYNGRQKSPHKNVVSVMMEFM